MTNDDYFVQIPDHTHVVESVLLGSRKVIESSQSYYKVLEIRREKTESFALLKTQVNELLSLSKELESILPYHELIKKARSAAARKKTSESKKSSSPKSSSKKSSSKSSTSTKSSTTSKEPVHKLSKEELEMKKLSDALASIESKLSAL